VKQTTTEFKLAIASAILLAGTAASFCKDPIRTYSVPKAPATVQKPVAMADAGDIPITTSPLHWTTPKQWQELAPTGIRVGNFLVPGKDDKKTEVTIMSFPGDVGGELANVNRWRNELGLTPVTEGEVSAQTVEVDAAKAKLYDFSSAQARTLVASLPRQGSTWFFKIRGDKEVVTQNAEVFQGFLKSIRFEDKGLDQASSSTDSHVHAEGENHIPASEAKDPHAGVAGASPVNVKPSDAGNADEPKWNVPPNWTAKAPGMMVLKSFGVSHEGKDAIVSISVFPGDVGGTFANVNRWRGQMGLGPIDESELATSISSVDVGNGVKGTLVDFNGTDAKTGKAARLVAISVPHADSTWFYKLLGDDGTVGHEKEAFIKFVQNVRYP
jgi:hypothetical protein